MDLRLQNKVVIVAGGAQGIGEAIVNHLMGEGALPVVFDRIPGSGFSLKVEFADRHSVAKAVRIVQEHFGRIDGLVNIEGSPPAPGPLFEHYGASIQSFEENLGQYYTVAQALQSYLTASKGSIVNMLPELWEPGQGEASGNDFRAALIEQWADDLRTDGVRVNGVVVSDFQSRRVETAGSRTGVSSLWRRFKRLIPIGNRLARGEEIAGTVAFLLSRASRSVNGKVLHIGGGYIHLGQSVRAN